MSLYRDEGVVLRTQKLGEADRIITLLTRSHGRVRAVGKGVRRTRSKFGARLEPFTHVDLQVYEGRSLDVVQQAETIASYGDRIADDYARYTTGTVMLETAERLTAEEKEPATQQFLLLVGGLRTLAEAAHAPGLVLDAFLLRSLAVAGYGASFDDCAQCARARSAPLLQHLGGRRGVRVLPVSGSVSPARGTLTSGRRCSPATGRPPTPATRGTGAKAAVWWRRTCSGTWNAACVRCRWSSAASEPAGAAVPAPAAVVEPRVAHRGVSRAPRCRRRPGRRPGARRPAGAAQHCDRRGARLRRGAQHPPARPVRHHRLGRPGHRHCR